MLDMLVHTHAKEWRLVPEVLERVWYWVKPDMLQHDIEYHTYDDAGNLGPRSAAPAPAVFILGEERNNKNSHSVKMTSELQLFNADLMSLSEYGRLFDDLIRFEREYIGSAFRGVFGDTKAFANNSGFQGDEPKVDYVNGKDLGAALPAYDKIRTCGTNSHTGVEAGRMLLVDTFDPNNLPKNYWVEILNDPRVFWATVQYRGGVVGQFPNLSKGVPLALVSRYPVYYPLENLQKYKGEKRPLYYA